MLYVLVTAGLAGQFSPQHKNFSVIITNIKNVTVNITKYKTIVLI